MNPTNQKQSFNRELSTLLECNKITTLKPIPRITAEEKRHVQKLFWQFVAVVGCLGAFALLVRLFGK